MGHDALAARLAELEQRLRMQQIYLGLTLCVALLALLWGARETVITHTHVETPRAYAVAGGDPARVVVITRDAEAPVARGYIQVEPR